MLKSMMVVLCVLITGFSKPLSAQDAVRVNDTLETIFENEPHKDGYVVEQKVMEIPSDIAAKCDKKRIRIIGQSWYRSSAYEAKPAKGVVEMRQGRNIEIPVTDDAGKVIFTTVFEDAGPTFDIFSISVWNERAKKWKLVSRSKQ